MRKTAAKERKRIVAQVLRRPYARLFHAEQDAGFSAEVLEFPGCFSSGDSAEEAMANLEDAMTVWVESQLDQGRRIPEPLSEREYSGRVTFRMPPGTHEEAARLAAVQGVSLNRWLSDAVARSVGYTNELSEMMLEAVTKQPIAQIVPPAPDP